MVGIGRWRVWTVAAAGGALLWGQVLRWGRCVDDAPACGAMPDHRFDAFLPTDPWTPVPGAALAEGMAFLLAAVVLAVAFRAVVWRLLVGAVAVVGGLTVVSGVTSTALPGNAAAQLGWMVVGPALVVVGVALAVRDGGRGRWLAVTAAAALAWHGSIPEFVVALAVSPSHDTPPWSGAVSAVALVGIGLVGAVRLHRRDSAIAGAPIGVQSREL